MKFITQMVLFLFLVSWGQAVGAHDGKHPKLSIKIINLSQGGQIKHRETLNTTDQFRVQVKTNGIDCAGQYVVTAIGAPGNPPSVLVTARTFTLGPFVGSNSYTGPLILTASVVPETLKNVWKISASCNASGNKHEYFAFVEFYVDLT